MEREKMWLYNKIINDCILGLIDSTKYLYHLAVELSQRPEPMCSSAILTFHDCVELFLQLGTEYKCISKTSIAFMDYWKVVFDEIEVELGQKVSMSRLNKARVSLKHHGTLPSKLAIDDFRVSVTNFFDENTPLLFGIEFSKISLIELISSENVKNILIEAKEFSEKREYENSLDKVAIAFNQLIDEYEDRKRTEFGRSPFFFGDSLTFVGSSFIGDSWVKMIPDEIINTLEALQKTVKILSLGIDYRRHSKFRLLTPSVMPLGEEKYHILRIDRKKELTEEVITFCINFVIESAMVLQDFDYEVDETMNLRDYDLKKDAVVSGYDYQSSLRHIHCPRCGKIITNKA